MAELIMFKLAVKKEYYPILLDIKENDVCIDCGANMGLFTRLVDSIKFSDFIKNEVLRKHDFIYLIKIDIEGEEFNVLEDIINENIYKKVGYIFVETHERFFENGEECINRIRKLIKENNIQNIYLDWI